LPTGATWGVSLPEAYGGGGMSEFDAILLQETVG
jgi:alkylation response protein AidB-like acyl-CoA dehydrogenase